MNSQQRASMFTQAILRGLQNGGPAAAGALNQVAWGYHDLTSAWIARDRQAIERASADIHRALDTWFYRSGV